MSKIMIKNARLSFPSIWNKATFDGKETKYEATLLFPKTDAKLKKILDDAIQAKMVEAKFKKLGADRICLKDGDESDYDGYADHWSLKASNTRRPTIVDQRKNPTTEDDGLLYAGCYVNAQIDFWSQNNSFGKRINANLLILQFLRDGEPFGADGDVGDLDDFDVEDDDYEDDDYEDDEIPF